MPFGNELKVTERINGDASLYMKVGVTFNLSDGKQTTDFGSFDQVYAIALSPTGKLDVAGDTGSGPNTGGDFAVARYSTGPKRVYALQDANYNVTAVVDKSGAAVIDRFVYDPYGVQTALDANWNLRPGNASQSGMATGFQGMTYDGIDRTYHTLNREYSPVLGRWDREDPAGYVDSTDLYNSYLSSPELFNDSTGLKVQIAPAPTPPQVAPEAIGPAGNGGAFLDRNGGSIVGVAMGVDSYLYENWGWYHSAVDGTLQKQHELWDWVTSPFQDDTPTPSPTQMRSPAPVQVPAPRPFPIPRQPIPFQGPRPTTSTEEDGGPNCNRMRVQLQENRQKGRDRREQFGTRSICNREGRCYIIPDKVPARNSIQQS